MLERSSKILFHFVIIISGDGAARRSFIAAAYLEMMIRTLKRRPAADYAWLAGGAAVGTGDGVRERERGMRRESCPPKCKCRLFSSLHFVDSAAPRLFEKEENHPEDNRRFIRGLLI